jgi:RsiW-degrading membrane proteinase PrsW (M82 family)
MRKRRREDNLRRKKNRRNSTTNSQISIQRQATEQMLILEVINPITEEKIKFIPVLKFIIHLEVNPIFNLVDHYHTYHH